MTSHQEREARVQVRVAAIQRHRDFPALADQIREVVEVSQDEDAALDRLAGLVLENYGLTLRVLRAVNSIHYNRSGQPILSVARAIVLLGVRTVREMAASFLVLDHYRRRSPELRQLMALSMVTASHAEGLCQWTPRARPDEAYVCGMFRNLGEVLIAHHFPDDYHQIGRRAESGGGVGDAALAVLGFRYEDLGAAMARLWGMPVVGDAILQLGSSAPLRAVTELGHLLTGAVYRGERAPSRDDLARLVSRFGAEVAIPLDRVSELIQSAAADVRKLFGGMGAVPKELEILNRAGAPAAGLEPPRSAVPTGFGLGSARETRDQLLAEAAGVTEAAGFDLDRVLLILLEALQRGGPFDRALFCLADSDRGEIRARLALGDQAEKLVRAFRFPQTGGETAIAAALADREPIFAAPPGWRPRDARTARVLGAQAFGLLPLVVDGAAIGCLYCDRRAAGPPPDAGTLIFLGRVQAMAEQAIGRSRRIAAAPFGAESHRSG